MKKILLMLWLVPQLLHADLAWEIEEEEIPERGLVNRCRISTEVLDCVLIPPQNWGWSAQPSANRITFTEPELGAGIQVEISKEVAAKPLVDRIKSTYKQVEILDVFEAITAGSTGEGCEAEIWTSDQFSYRLREAVFKSENGVITVRMQGPKESFSKAQSAWTMVLNSLREVSKTAKVTKVSLLR